MGLRTEAEAWLRKIGSDQWSDAETGERAIAKWHKAIEGGQTWIVRDEVGDTVATVSRGEADRDFWKEGDELHTAFYLYKLIVSRSAGGSDLGALVLDWACKVAALEGRHWVRIDCWRTNRSLQKYYEKLGFTHVRTEAPAHRKSGWLAQRSSGLLTHSDRPLVIETGSRSR